jgi:hypothetical protein
VAKTKGIQTALVQMDLKFSWAANGSSLRTTTRNPQSLISCILSIKASGPDGIAEAEQYHIFDWNAVSSMVGSLLSFVISVVFKVAFASGVRGSDLKRPMTNDTVYVCSR